MIELCGEHGVSAVCSALGLSRSGHYARAKAGPSARRRRDDQLKATILRLATPCPTIH